MITLRTLLAVPGVDELKVIAGEAGLDRRLFPENSGEGILALEEGPSTAR